MQASTYTMKRLMSTLLLGGTLAALGGCVYGPGYYQRQGVVYDDGHGNPSAGATVESDDYAADADYYYDAAPGYYYSAAPGYYYNPWGWYGPGFGLGLGFFGGYYYGHGYHGPWRGGHGSWHGSPHSVSHAPSGGGSHHSGH